MRHLGVLNVVAASLSTVADAQGNIVCQNNAFFPIDERSFINTVTHHRCGKPGDARTRPQPPRRMAASPRAPRSPKRVPTRKSRRLRDQIGALREFSRATPARCNLGDTQPTCAEKAYSASELHLSTTIDHGTQPDRRRRGVQRGAFRAGPCPRVKGASLPHASGGPGRARPVRRGLRGSSLRASGPSVCMSRRGDHRDRHGVIARNSAS